MYSEATIFPVDLSPANDLLLTEVDLKAQSVPMPGITAIAAALLEKRNLMLRHYAKSNNGLDDNLDVSPFTLKARPEVSLLIDNVDLTRHEKPVEHRSLSAIMDEICSCRRLAECAKADAKARTEIKRINKVIKLRTDGRYGLGFRKKYIVVIDNKVRCVEFALGARSIVLPTRYASNGAERSMPPEVLNYFTARVGKGIPYNESRKLWPVRQSAMKNLLSRTNRFLASAGYPELTFVYIQGVAYLFDLTQADQRNRLQMVRSLGRMDHPGHCNNLTKAETKLGLA